MNYPTSCAGCRHYLGGGHCRINMEDECGEGFRQLYEPKEWGGVDYGGNQVDQDNNGHV